MKTIKLICMLLVFSAAACQSPANDTSKKDTPQSQSETAENVAVDIDKDTFLAMVEKGGVTILDVRTPEEFNEGHVEGAINIDFLENTFDAGIETLDKDVPVMLYCRSGGRSAKAKKKLEASNFSAIYHLEDGYLSLK